MFRLVMPQGVQLLRNGGHYSFAGMVSMLSLLLLAAHVQNELGRRAAAEGTS